MDLALTNNPITLLTFLIDGLFGVLAIVLIKKIVAKQSSTLAIPFFISAFAIGTLLFFYLNDTVAIANVWLNSHQSTPLLYKITGIWGNHEGSMLLFYTFMTTWSAVHLRQTEAIRLGSFILLAIGGYIYLSANPFEILAIKAAAGQDLNPALQNPYLAIHPPILYAGQTLCFVLWIWACVSPDHPRIHLYTRVCFGLITLGLVLGARWAYGELGWGGFWFWDPVETVSLFPWLAIAAAVHTSKYAPTTHRTCLLISFPMVMLGMTLVRSGVLVSVHSFGFDLHNGIWLGACTFAVCMISGLVLYKNRSIYHPRKHENRHCEGQRPVAIQCIQAILMLLPGFLRRLSAPLNDEIPNQFTKQLRIFIPFGFLCALAILCALILGPVILKTCFSMDLAIDENFFHQYINPCLLMLLIFAGFAPQIKTHRWSFLCAILCTSIWCLIVQPYFHFFAVCATFVGFWLIVSTINSIKYVFTRGFIAAHLGVGLCILGASHGEIFTLKQEFKISELPIKFASHTIKYTAQSISETPQVTKEIVTFMVDGKPLIPERQHFHISKVTKHQPAWVKVNLDHIHAIAFADGDVWKVELMSKPLITLFWLGIVFVLLGILVSMKGFSQQKHLSKETCTDSERLA